MHLPLPVCHSHRPHASTIPCSITNTNIVTASMVKLNIKSLYTVCAHQTEMPHALQVFITIQCEWHVLFFGEHEIPGTVKEVSLPYFYLLSCICTLRMYREEKKKTGEGGGEKRGGLEKDGGVCVCVCVRKRERERWSGLEEYMEKSRRRTREEWRRREGCLCEVNIHSACTCTCINKVYYILSYSLAKGILFNN